MASTESLVLAAWVTRLSVPNGAGDYLYDLTPSGTVRLGSPTQTAARLSVYIDEPRFVVETLAQGRVTCRCTVRILGFVGATGNVPGTQMRACADLWADLKRAVYADRTLGVTGVIDAGVEGSVLQDEEGKYLVGAEGYATWTEAAS